MKRLLIGFTTAAMLFTTACDTPFIDPALNTDPNSLADAGMTVILPVTQASLGYVMGGDIGRYSSLLTQHNEGVDRQHLGIYNYTFTESDVDNSWSTMYSGIMKDLKIIMDKADAAESPHYKGVAQIMFAYTMCTVTDLYGHVPYSDAFKGDAAEGRTTTPKYDKQADIYASLMAMLVEAQANLTAASKTSPSRDDLIYGGNRGSWAKAAKSLMARMSMHMVKSGKATLDDVITHASAGIAANDENFSFTFGTAQNNANPWYQFTTQRDGDLAFNGFFAKILSDRNDPRAAVYADSIRVGSYLAAIDAPVTFVTAAEVNFLKAEAEFAKGNKPGAHAAYVEGVKASMEAAGVDGTAYLATLPAADALTLDEIMTQKYIAMYGNVESYSDWRRTGLPTLTPAPASGKQIPRRWPYPQDERVYNTDNYQAGAAMTDPVWWD
ncbi:MAG: SusD/RagB family nutrient-binding outer membrane lipoprotein [Candidatus Kapabacteria bacterium]|nr:SusD/RagB family nutrient-binding outer membrane lipoprotein [Candidatus Kapabacteria bacterium]